MDCKRESAGRQINYVASSDFFIDDTFVKSIIELLFFSKDIGNSIQSILRMLSDYYHVPYVNIVEETVDKENCHTTYEYRNTQGKLGADSVALQFTGTDWQRYKQIFDEHGLYYSDQLTEFYNYNLALYSFLKEIHLKSTLQCAILENGCQKGFIALYDKTKVRSWTTMEINTFAVVSKILSAYLLKLRLSEMNEKNLWLDSLTGSWNLTKFTREVNTFLLKRQRKQYAIVYVDIRNFKFFNDVYGYSEGDRILIAFAEKLREFLYKDEMFGRITSDNFVALVRYHSLEELLRRFKVFTDEMNKIKKNSAESYRIVMRAGVCMIEPNCDSITSIIDKANIARQSIKGYHKSMYNFYHVELRQQIAKEKGIEDRMEAALQNHEFIVYYQPKIDLVSHRMVGAEALVRWNRPEYGLVPPDEFIPIFEKNGFIIEMDFYVFDQVCKNIRQWLDEKMDVVPISVNFSRVHLKSPCFIQRLVEIADRYHIPRGLIELELTESAFIENADALLQLFNELKDLRFTISLDDFGTGFSALKLLTELPVDVLKLDKDFLKKGQATKREQIVLAHVIRMSKDLDIKVVSEGVETMEQADFLTKIGCNLAQGYLFARPMPEPEFIHRLKIVSGLC